MTHINVLGIAVFTSMPCLYSHFIRYLNVMRVVKEDDIWKISAKMWEELPSYKISNAFCLAKSIAKEIVKFEGVIWLASRRRKKFKDTD